MSTELAGIVLAGGSGSRLGGMDKPALEHDGRSLLDRVVEAVAERADPIVVVGPERPTSCVVTWTSETPSGGGPLAGIAAGLSALGEAAPLVAVLPADHPNLTARTLDRLIRAVRVTDRGGAVLTDAGGNPQWLLGVWQRVELANAMPMRVRDVAARDVLGSLQPAKVPARPAEVFDIDTERDLRKWRAQVDG